MIKRFSCKISDTQNWKQDIIDFHYEVISDLRIDEYSSNDVYVILEELVSNYFKYSISENTPTEIKAEIIFEEPEMRIKLEYESIEFDPFSYVYPEAEIDIEGASVGGHGIHMVKKIANSYWYERKDKKNILYIHKIIYPETDMNIVVQEQPKVTVISLEGRLDILSGESLQKTFDELIDEKKLVNLIIDCEKLSFISSAGLRLFMIVLKKLNKINGRLAFCSFNLNNRKIFDITGYDKFFCIFDNLDESLKAFND